MRKVGLYRDSDTGAWYSTRGAAPTTHIVKVPNEALFPFETINEAICLTVARLSGIETEEFELIPTEHATLLAARRFDRPIPDEPIMVKGVARPLRLHQEDLCQLGDTSIKYEPSGAHYLSFATHLIRGACANAFGESMGLLCHVFLDYLLGNCDNHHKTSQCTIGTCNQPCSHPHTTSLIRQSMPACHPKWVFPLSFDRPIVGVTKDDVVRAIRHAGFPEKLALGEFECIRDDALRNFPKG